MTTLKWGAATDVGLVRTNNQDRFLVSFPLFVVADGMGGHQGGEIASQTTIDAMTTAFVGSQTPERLVESVQMANRAVLARASEDEALAGMGTTVTALALVADGDDETIAVANVGDSRTYVLRLGELIQVTDDHSVPEEMVRMGLLSHDQAATHEKRHILTRALGVEDPIEVDLFRITPYKGERFLLCSDGLVREVGETQIAAVLRRIADPEEAASELVTMAVTHGGSDNVTVVVVDVVDDGGRSERASTQVPLEELASYGTWEDEHPASDHQPPVAATATPAKPRNARRRVFTVRLVLFFAALLVVVVGTFAGIRAWATSGAFVKSDAVGQIVIWSGRPGGTLIWEPEIVEVTTYTLDDLRPENRATIESGRTVADVDAARQLVESLISAANTPRGNNSAPRGNSATTVPASTSTSSTAP
jgi:protein phosphatase